MFSTLHNQTSVVSELQTVHAEFNVRKEATELVLNPPPGGVVDGYQETVFITDPIQTRLNGFVDITNEYGVIKRDSTVVFVANSVFGTGSEYIDNTQEQMLDLYLVCLMVCGMTELQMYLD